MCNSFFGPFRHFPPTRSSPPHPKSTGCPPFSLTIILHGLMGADEPALKEIDTMQQEIIKCYEKSNELEPHNAKTLMNLGIMCGFQGRFTRSEEYLTKSEEYLTKALEIDGKLGESLGAVFWQSKAAALEGLKKYDEAVECIDEGL